MTLQEKFDKFLNRFRKVPLTQVIHFCRNLQVMIRAGLSLSVGLQTLKRQTENKKLQSIIEDIYQDVEKGGTLADSLARYPDTFSELFINMVRAGERSGKLEGVLEQLAVQMKKTRDLVAKVKGALTYPIFVVAATVGIGIFVFVFVIPKITVVFKELEATLPWTTRTLIATSQFVVGYGWLLLIGLVILVILLLKIVVTNTGRHLFHKILLKLPILGVLLKKIDLARFARTFSVLLVTDIPIVESLKLTAGVLTNVWYRDVLMETSKAVERGVPVSEVLKKSPKLFPPIMTQMMAVGEQTGTLDSILADVTQFYEDDVERTVANLSSIIEPILIVVLGIAVAGIALAVVMPMYSLTQQM